MKEEVSQRPHIKLDVEKEDAQPGVKGEVRQRPHIKLGVEMRRLEQLSNLNKSCDLISIT